MSYYYVYIITFSNNKFYIGKRKSSVPPHDDINYWGSPVTFSFLWEDHSLKKEKHIIKICDNEFEVSELEKNLILYSWKKYPDLCLNRHSSVVFHSNIGAIGGNVNAEKTAREFTIKSPEGEIIEGKNVSKFCRDFNLNLSNILRVLDKKQKHHKGWCLPTTKSEDIKITNWGNY